ncbi:hypothetical protein MBLNU230_g4005t1 [Neophaeotheca triangularis]
MSWEITSDSGAGQLQEAQPGDDIPAPDTQGAEVTSGGDVHTGQESEADLTPALLETEGATLETPVLKQSSKAPETAPADQEIPLTNGAEADPFESSLVQSEDSTHPDSDPQIDEIIVEIMQPAEPTPTTEVSGKKKGKKGKTKSKKSAKIAEEHHIAHLEPPVAEDAKPDSEEHVRPEKVAEEADVSESNIPANDVLAPVSGEVVASADAPPEAVSGNTGNAEASLNDIPDPQGPDKAPEQPGSDPTLSKDQSVVNTGAPPPAPSPPVAPIDDPFEQALDDPFASIPLVGPRPPTSGGRADNELAAAAEDVLPNFDVPTTNGADAEPEEAPPSSPRTVSSAPGTPDPKSRKKKTTKGSAGKTSKSKKKKAVSVEESPDDIVAIVDGAEGAPAAPAEGVERSNQPTESVEQGDEAKEGDKQVPASADPVVADGAAPEPEATKAGKHEETDVVIEEILDKDAEPEPSSSSINGAIAEPAGEAIPAEDPAPTKDAEPQSELRTATELSPEESKENEDILVEITGEPAPSPAEGRKKKKDKGTKSSKGKFRGQAISKLAAKFETQSNDSVADITDASGPLKDESITPVEGHEGADQPKTAQGDSPAPADAASETTQSAPCTDATSETSKVPSEPTEPTVDEVSSSDKKGNDNGPEDNKSAGPPDGPGISELSDEPAVDGVAAEEEPSKGAEESGASMQAERDVGQPVVELTGVDIANDATKNSQDPSQDEAAKEEPSEGKALEGNPAGQDISTVGASAEAAPNVEPNELEPRQDEAEMGEEGKASVHAIQMPEEEAVSDTGDVGPDADKAADEDLAADPSDQGTEEGQSPEEATPSQIETTDQTGEATGATSNENEGDDAAPVKTEDEGKVEQEPPSDVPVADGSNTTLTHKGPQDAPPAGETVEADGPASGRSDKPIASTTEEPPKEPDMTTPQAEAQDLPQDAAAAATIAPTETSPESTQEPPAPPSPTLSKSSSKRHPKSWQRPSRKRESLDLPPPKSHSTKPHSHTPHPKTSSTKSRDRPRNPHRSSSPETRARREARRAEIILIRAEEAQRAEEEELRRIRHEERRRARKRAAEATARSVREELARKEAEEGSRKREKRRSEVERTGPRPGLFQAFSLGDGESVTKAGLFVRSSVERSRPLEARTEGVSEVRRVRREEGDKRDRGSSHRSGKRRDSHREEARRSVAGEEGRVGMGSRAGNEGKRVADEVEGRRRSRGSRMEGERSHGGSHRSRRGSERSGRSRLVVEEESKRPGFWGALRRVLS